jgi:hypothetical protein
MKKFFSSLGFGGSDDISFLACLGLMRDRIAKITAILPKHIKTPIAKYSPLSISMRLPDKNEIPLTSSLLIRAIQ